MIFFIYSKQTHLVRIGETNDLHRQLRTFQANSPDKLTLIRAFDIEDGGYRDIQVYFRNEWSHGDWFRLSERLQQYIHDIPTSKYDYWEVEAYNPVVQKAIENAKKGENLGDPIKPSKGRKQASHLDGENDFIIESDLPMPLPEEQEQTVVSNGAQPLDPMLFTIKVG